MRALSTRVRTVLALLGLAGWPALYGALAEDPLAAKLEVDMERLSALRREIGDEKVPMVKRLNELETESLDARKAFDAVKRKLDTRNLDINNLRNENKAREQERNYLSNLLGEYIRNLETRIHIAELDRYREIFEAARLAPENGGLSAEEIFRTQTEVVWKSLERLEGLLGGDLYAGRAAGENGLIEQGTFLLLGPVAYFASDDGDLVGVAEQQLGSLEPSVRDYADPTYGPMTATLIETASGHMPFDGSLGNARKVEETRETFAEHLAKGGAVVYPIGALAGLVLLLAAGKWIALTLVPFPREKQLQGLFDAVSRSDRPAVADVVERIKGPVGRMLRAGAEHLDDPRELMEEVMYEKMLDSRFRMNRGLPFIAVGAACAPLLGLLGTVTGIISTFKLLTIFGSGDIKMLSAGISEALVTTECGLYVAIPSLLLHAFLSRKAKALLDRMERVAVGFLGEASKARVRRKAA
jgi:biopolymer transport protein ExbB